LVTGSLVGSHVLDLPLIKRGIKSSCLLRVQGVISENNYHVDLLHLRTSTGTQILDLRRDVYNFAVSNDGTEVRDLEANPANNWHPPRAGSRMDAQYLSQGMNVEALQYAVLRVKKPLQGYKGGEIETLLKGQSQMRAALADADKLLEASQHPWLRDAPKRVHAVGASPATQFCTAVCSDRSKPLDSDASLLGCSDATRIGAPQGCHKGRCACAGAGHACGHSSHTADASMSCPEFGDPVREGRSPGRLVHQARAPRLSHHSKMVHARLDVPHRGHGEGTGEVGLVTCHHVFKLRGGRS
jgi:hypothetical protein